MTARVYWWDRTLQYQGPRVVWGGLGAEDTRSKTFAFLAANDKNLTVASITAFLKSLPTGSRDEAIGYMQGLVPSDVLLAAAKATKASTEKPFPTKTVVLVGAGLVGALALVLVLR